MLQPNHLYWLGFLAAGLALLYAALLWRKLKRPLGGSGGLHRAKSLVKQGALSILKWHGVLLFALVALGFGILMALRSFDRLPNPYLPVAFLTGAVCALLPQLLDLRYAPRWTAQTAAAMEASRPRGMRFLLFSARLRTFLTLGLTLLEVSGWICYLTLRAECSPEAIAQILLTFGLSGALVAFLARHLGSFSAVGVLGSLPLESAGQPLPPQDQRNPSSAVYSLSSFLHDPASALPAAWRCLLPAAATLGVLTYGPQDLGAQAALFPLLVLCAGALATLISSLRGFPSGKPLDRLHYRRLWGNLWLTLLLTGAAALPCSFLLFGSLRPCFALFAGLLAAPLVAWGTQLAALAVPEPAGRNAGQKVPVTTWLILGLYGLLPLMLLTAALLSAFLLAGGADTPVFGLYGVALAGVGLLSPAGEFLVFSSCGAAAQGAISLTWMSGDMAEPVWAGGLEVFGKRLSYAGRGYSLGVTLTTSLLLLLCLAGKSPLPDRLTLGLGAGVLLGIVLLAGLSALLLWGGHRTVLSLSEEIKRQYKETKGTRSGKSPSPTLPCVDLAAVHSLFWSLVCLLSALLLTALMGALAGTEGLLGLSAAVTVPAFLPGFFFLTAGDHWGNTPLAKAVFPLRWAVGPFLGDLALLVLTAALTLL